MKLKNQKNKMMFCINKNKNNNNQNRNEKKMASTS